MRMARVNVSLPDDLAAAAKAADLNVSSLTQNALRKALAAANLDRWLADIDSLGSVEVDRASVKASIAAPKDEILACDGHPRCRCLNNGRSPPRSIRLARSVRG